MPIVISAETVNGTDESVAAFLEQDGKPTLQGEVLRRFLDEVDYDPLFEALLADEDGKSLVETTEGFAKWDKELGCFVECDEDDEGAEKVEIQTVDGDVVAEVIDMEDLETMFEYHMVNEHDRESLQGRLEASIFGYHEMSEEELEEFKKGDFRRIHKQGGKALVNRMLGAMLNKEAIQRAKQGPGSGYRSGDYDKDPAGYGAGTPGGQKRFALYKKKSKAKLKKEELKTKKKKVKLGGKVIGAAGKKAAAKKGMAAAVKSIKAKKAKSKKKLAASVEEPGANIQESRIPGTRNNRSTPVLSDVSEGATLASRVVSLGKPMLAETETKK